MADFIPFHAANGETIVAPEYAADWSPDWFGDAAGAAQPLAGGRGSAHRVSTPLGPLVRRDYLRGGLPRHLSRDRYLWTGAWRTRSWQEFQLTRRLRQQGLAVPEPIAARWQRRGLVYRASLLTRWLGEVRSLLSVLADGADPARLLPPVAQAVAQLHQRGVWHADLNATNIQIEGQDRVWLIDFDRARDRVTDSRRLAGNLERLRRSLRKYLPAPRLAAVEACWPAFVSHYQAARAERQ